MIKINRKKIFNELNSLLKQLPKKERNKTITYYNELINDYIEDGLSEKEAILKLGDIKSIANEILLDNEKNLNNSTSLRTNIWIIVLLVLGFPICGSLLLVGAILVIVFYIVLYCPILVLAFFTLTLLGTSIVCVVATPFVIMENLAYSLFQLGVGISLLGLAIIFAFLAAIVTKYIIKASIFIWKKILALFKKRGA